MVNWVDLTTSGGAIVLAGASLVVLPSPAYACSCGGAPPPAVIRGSAAVFVGTVEGVVGPQPWSARNADGSISGGLGSGPRTATFVVGKVFRGRAQKRVVIPGDGTSCDVPFARGETWLIYASERGGAITTGKCTRTRLLSEAIEDIKYLEGLEQGRTQAAVYGNVHRRIIGPDGRPSLYAPLEPLQVVAVGAGRRFTVTAEKWGPYLMVLPPGDFEVWVERAGRPVTAVQAVRVSNGDERPISFSVQF